MSDLDRVWYEHEYPSPVPPNPGFGIVHAGHARAAPLLGIVSDEFVREVAQYYAPYLKNVAHFEQMRRAAMEAP